MEVHTCNLLKVAPNMADPIGLNENLPYTLKNDRKITVNRAIELP